MYSLEKLKFCEARSMVFKHTHNVCMALKGLHQVHEQKSYREAEGTQDGTLFKAVQSWEGLSMGGELPVISGIQVE